MRSIERMLEPSANAPITAICLSVLSTFAMPTGRIETRKAATAATRAVGATERSIGHMEEANRISRENMQAGQRAYIAFPMLDFQTLRVADDTGAPIAFRFRLAVENTGNTPALNLIMRVNYWGQDGDQGLPSNYDFRDFAPPGGPAEDYPMYL